MADALTLDTTTDDACIRLAALYGGVSLSGHPLNRWLHLLNDATILAEDIRRGRNPAALSRLAVVLSRVFEFIGFFLYSRQVGEVVIVEGQDGAIVRVNEGDFLAVCFRHRSARNLQLAPLVESLTKWILVKYPHACGKCGARPCHCVVTPWIFEERRENPGPYRAFSEKVERLRTKNQNWREMTLEELFPFFASIYKNSFYPQDSWKLLAHLSEELGEATVELNRLQLVCGTEKGVIERELDGVFERSAARLRQESQRIGDKQERAVSLERWTRQLDDVKTQARRLREVAQAREWIQEVWLPAALAEAIAENAITDVAQRLFFAELVSDKLKEEIADVVSWIAALACKLTGDDRGLRVMEELVTRYSDQIEGTRQMACSWCRQEKCSNECLIRYSLRDEIVQRVMKM